MSILQTNVIDFISIDSNRRELVLTISDHLDWEIGQEEHLWLLQEKINRYVAYLESGEVLEKFPDARERRVRIAIVGAFHLSALAEEFFKAASQVLAGADLRLSHEVVRSAQAGSETTP